MGLIKTVGHPMLGSGDSFSWAGTDFERTGRLFVSKGSQFFRQALQAQGFFQLVSRASMKPRPDDFDNLEDYQISYQEWLYSLRGKKL